MALSAAQRALADVSLFSALDEPQQLDEIVSLMRPFAVEPGNALFQQGDPGDGLYVLTKGRAIVRARMPGDYFRTIDSLSPGAVLGEISLIDRESRSATVEAATRVEGWYLDERAFRVLRAANRTAARRVMEHICGVVCERIRSRVTDVARATDPPNVPWSTSAKRVTAPPPRIPVSFEPSLLAKLPIFAGLRSSDRVALITAGKLVEASRGEVLWVAGGAANRCYLMLRGALEISIDRTNGGAERLFVLGPGQVAGIEALFDARPYPSRCTVLEPAWFVSIGVDELRSFPQGSLGSADWLHALAVQLVDRLRALTRQVSRLSAQGRLPGSH